MVFPESVAGLRGRWHGPVIERWGPAGAKDHQRFLLEDRADRVGIAGQVMTSVARALTSLRAGSPVLDAIPRASLRLNIS